MSAPEISRRNLLELIGAMTVLAACSSSSTPQATNTGSRTSSTSGEPSTTSSTVAPTVISTTATADTISLDGPAQPAANQFTNEQLTRFRDRYAGQWRCAWTEDGDRKGTADLAVAIDVDKRIGVYTATFDGPFLGGSAPIATTYEIGINQFDATKVDLSVLTRQVGKLDITIEGFGQLHVTAADIPGHPDIASVDIVSRFSSPGKGSTTYTINRTGGKTERGAIAAVKDGARPDFPALSDANGLNAFVYGTYAAGLITQGEATKLVGQPCKAPEANGGRFNYAPGINASNARIETVVGFEDLAYSVIQYSIFRASTAEAMQTFFETRLTTVRSIPNLGAAAAAIPADASSRLSQLYVRAQIECMDLNVVRGPNSVLPPKEQTDGLLLSVAATIVKNLR